MIVCENLTRYYGTYPAVDNLSVEIPSGAVCALVGPNGAGKSTTMKMLSTLLRPSFGRAFIGGREIQGDTNGVRRLIGYLPEAFQMYEDLTVKEYLMFFAKAYDLNPQSTTTLITDFLERLGLVEKRSAKVGELSRGMRQRLGVAKSFLHNPDVVFLDEPASGLDPVARTELRDFLKFQQSLQKTVVVSSHVLKELADFCDYILIMSRGNKVEFGPLAGQEGVMAKYAEEEVEGRTYTIRVLKDVPRLEELLRTKPLIQNLKTKEQFVSYDFKGSEVDAAKLLAEITNARIPVVKFGPEELDLEHIYKKIGGREEDE